MKHRLFALLGIALAILVVGYAPAVSADVNDFTIRSFHSDQTLTREDRQGELRIVENIDLEYTDNNHGILRALPNTYKKHRLLLHINDVSSKSGAPSEYSTYTQNGNTVLKIGDPDKTVTGRQQYTIDYTVKNVISFQGDHDELYWDINGDQWAQQFKRVEMVLHLPDGAELAGRQVCYAGKYGSTAGDCVVRVNAAKTGEIYAATTRPLLPYETLSTRVSFEKGYFTPSTWRDTLGEYGADIAVFLVPVLLLGGTAGVYWWRHGRDPRGRGVIVPEYGPPEGLGPIEVGTLIDFRTDNKDITAAIIDLAVRRYITIIEHKQDRKLRRDITTYILRLEKSGYGELNEFERKIMAGLFGNAEPGTEVDLSQQKFKLAETATVLRTTVKRSLETRGYFNPSAFKLRTFFQCVAAIIGVIITGVVAVRFSAALAFGLGAALGATLAAIFMLLAPSRTVKGVAAKDQVMGMKMYLETAEADRIRMLQSPNARYAANVHSKEPKRTVDLFEKLLPYAMILGVEALWAKQFEHIYRTPPDWYSGNWSTFSVVYLASSLSGGMNQEVNTAFTAPSSASGGGGGAGGGGGGGGGGGW
jgi:hypothetical protein